LFTKQIAQKIAHGVDVRFELFGFYLRTLCPEDVRVGILWRKAFKLNFTHIFIYIIKILNYQNLPQYHKSRASGEEKKD
jgi:hypothetical protein